MIAFLMPVFLVTQALTQLSDAGGTCPLPLISGSTMVGAYPATEFAHSITVTNGTESNAFVKLRALDTEKRTVMYLGKGGSGAISNIPDGTYEVLFAYEGRLASDCEYLIKPDQAMKFQEKQTFKIEVTETSEGQLYEASDLRFTLYSVRGGKAASTKISVDEFNRD